MTSIQEVFNNSKALSLPPFHDCTIELLLSASLPTSHQYNLSKLEWVAMENFNGCRVCFCRGKGWLALPLTSRASKKKTHKKIPPFHSSAPHFSCTLFTKLHLWKAYHSVHGVPEIRYRLCIVTFVAFIHTSQAMVKYNIRLCHWSPSFLWENNHAYRHNPRKAPHCFLNRKNTGWTGIQVTWDTYGNSVRQETTVCSTGLEEVLYGPRGQSHISVWDISLRLMVRLSASIRS